MYETEFKKVIGKRKKMSRSPEKSEAKSKLNDPKSPSKFQILC